MNKQEQKTLLYVGGGVAAWFLVVKPLLVKLGLAPSAQDIQNANTVDQFLTNTINAGTPTKTAGEWQIIANQVWEDMRYSSVSDNYDDAVYQLCRVKNDADLASLFQQFGNRQETWFGVIPAGGDKNLQQFVVDNLSSAQIATVNDNYARKGIKFNF
jgi:hypothetical protein